MNEVWLLRDANGVIVGALTRTLVPVLDEAIHTMTDSERALYNEVRNLSEQVQAVKDTCAEWPNSAVARAVLAALTLPDTRESAENVTT